MFFRNVLCTMSEFYFLRQHEFRGNSNSINPFTDITLVLLFSFSPTWNEFIMDVCTHVILWYTDFDFMTEYAMYIRRGCCKIF